ncbi:MAG: permease prefix domain 2-containing transporter [Bacteroidota bacterium]
MLRPVLPSILLRFLRWFCHPDLIEDVEGDLSELYAERASKSKISAKIRFAADILLLIRPGMVKNFQPFNNTINYAMITNYLKIAGETPYVTKGTPY